MSVARGPVSFFVPTVLDVVGPALERSGLALAGTDEVGATWASGSALVRLSYLPELVPHSVNIGVSPSADRGGLRTVGLWAVIPDADDGSAYPLWTFMEEIELRQLLGEVTLRVLLPYGPLLWNDEERLEGLLVDQAAREREQFELDRLDQALAQARWLFDHQRFAEACDAFVLAGEDRLSAADRRRLYVARKELDPS